MSDIAANAIQADVLNVTDSLMSQSSPMQNTAKPVPPTTAMFEKCSHPPKAVAGFVGLPTNDSRTQVVLEYENVGINKQPVIYDPALTMTRTATAADLATFDIAILHTNGARVLSNAFVHNAATQDMQPDYANNDIQDNYDFDNFQEDATVYRPCYKSTTTSLNATQFNDTGLVAANQFNPSILFGGTLVALSQSNPSLFSEYCKTMHARNSILSSPREEHHATHRSHHESFPGYVIAETLRILNLPANSIINLDPNTSVQIANFGHVKANTIVPTPSQILNQSGRAASWPAKDGSFTVQRINTIAPKWMSAATTSAVQAGLYQCFSYFFDASNAPHLVPFSDNCPAGTAASAIPIMMDTQWTSDMTWGWTYYQGLSLNSQTSTSTQLLIKKYYTGYEVQPAVTSAWAGVKKLGPKPDLAAMQALVDFFYDQKDVMPAKYNFLGSLVKLAVPHLKKFATGLFGDATAAPKKTSNASANKRAQIVERSAGFVGPQVSRRMQQQRNRTTAAAPAEERRFENDERAMLRLSRRLQQLEAQIAGVSIQPKKRTATVVVAPKRKKRAARRT